MSNSSQSGVNTRASGRVGLGKTQGDNSEKGSKKPVHSGGSEKGEGEEAARDKCGNCKKIVPDGENGVECEICNNWFHASCEGLSMEVYAALVHTCIHWYCTSCNVRVVGIIKKVAKLEEGQAKLEEAMGKTRSELGAVQKEITDTGLALGNTQMEVRNMKVSVEKVMEETKVLTEKVGKLAIGELRWHTKGSRKYEGKCRESHGGK